MESSQSLQKGDLDNTLTESVDGGEPETLEQNYNEKIMDNLALLKEIRIKRSEVMELKGKYEHLENVLEQERADFETDKQEWANLKDDLLKVVSAAEDYRNEAMKKVKVAIEEKLVLEKKVESLERKLASLMGGGEPQPLLGNNYNRNNALEVPSCDEPMSSDSVDSSRCPSADLVHNKMSHGDNKENDYNPSDNNSDINISNGNSFLKRLNDRNNKANESAKLQDTDPLITLRSVAGGSKRNALLRWCQNRTAGYNYVDITNFSTSWSDGMALNALLHSYLPELIPYEKLSPENCQENFEVAFKAAETAAIPSSLSIDDMISEDRPSWEKVMGYIKEIYSVLEGCD